MMVSLKEFDAAFESVVKQLVQDHLEQGADPKWCKRFEQLLRYMVPNGSAYKGHLVLSAYLEIIGEKCAADDIALGIQLGWVFQLLIAYVLFIDDLFDQDEVRYGKPTWFALHKNNRLVTNDLIVLQNAIYRFLELNFRNHSCYPRLVKYVNQLILDTSLGQEMDCRVVSEETCRESDILENLEKMHEKIVYYLVYVPTFGVFSAAMILAGISEDSQMWKQVESVSADIALCVVISDDTNDCFDSSERNCDNKDIKNGRPRWVILKCKQLCTPEQWSTVIGAYGKSDDKSVNTVKKVITELGIQEMGQREMSGLAEKARNKCDDMIKNGDIIGKVARSLLKLVMRSNEY